MEGTAKTLVVNDISSTCMVIPMYSNGIVFDTKEVGEEDFRSVFPSVPIVVLLDAGNNSIELDFQKAVGEVEITVSLDGVIIYYSSENVRFAIQKFIDLLSEVSGSCLIEIKGENGAYVYGIFSL